MAEWVPGWLCLPRHLGRPRQQLPADAGKAPSKKCLISPLPPHNKPASQPGARCRGDSPLQATPPNNYPGTCYPAHLSLCTFRAVLAEGHGSGLASGLPSALSPARRVLPHQDLGLVPPLPSPGVHPLSCSPPLPPFQAETLPLTPPRLAAPLHSAQPAAPANARASPEHHTGPGPAVSLGSPPHPSLHTDVHTPSPPHVGTRQRWGD